MSSDQIPLFLLERLSHQAVQEFGSFIFACSVFILFSLSIPFVILNYRRVALILMTFAALVAFLIPTPLTCYMAPLLVFTCITGLLVITIQQRRISLNKQ